MSCLLSDVTGYSIKSVSTAGEQVLLCPYEVGGAVATLQKGMQWVDASIPVMEEPVNEVLSIPQTEDDCLIFPNLQGTKEEEEEEEEEEKEEDEEEEGNN